MMAFYLCSATAILFALASILCHAVDRLRKRRNLRPHSSPADVLGNPWGGA